MIGTDIKETKTLCGGNRLYVIQNDFQMIKIGITNNIYKRFKAIQCASGLPIIKFYVSDSLANYKMLEKDLHKYFSDNNTFGEWYKDLEFDCVVDYITDAIENNGEKIVKKYHMNKNHQKIIDLDRYADIYSKMLFFREKMYGYSDTDEKISEGNQALQTYEKIYFSEMDVTDKVIMLAPCAEYMRKMIFQLADDCDWNLILSTPVFFSFFNEYYGVEKIS